MSNTHSVSPSGKAWDLAVKSEYLNHLLSITVKVNDSTSPIPSSLASNPNPDDKPIAIAQKTRDKKIKMTAKEMKNPR